MIPGTLPDLQLQSAPSQTWKLDPANKRISGTADGLDAVVQSALLALATERGCSVIFPDWYGSEQHMLIGMGVDYVFSESKRMISEALLTDSRITAVRDFSYQDGVITFTMDTIFGPKILNTEVRS